MPTPDYAPNREEARAALAAYEGRCGAPAELTSRYVAVNRLDSHEPPIVLYEMRQDGDTGWLDPEGFYVAVSLTEYFEI